MLTVNSEDRARIAPLFADMEDTMIRSCLQGRMGEAYADALPPACAQILLGDFAFLAGDAQDPAAEALARVQQAGGHNHIFTHRGSSTRWYLREHGLLDRFSLLVTSEDGLPRKPAPDGILRILQRSGAPREAFAMVGDREIDVLAAHNAGILACRFAPEEPDVSTEAEIVLTDLRDILKAIEEERTK